MEWLIQGGSDVHEAGDAPLMRASLDGARTPMMALLVRHGADVNAAWHGTYPILYASETLDADALRWLLQHGADPNCGADAGRRSRLPGHCERPEELFEGTALDYALRFPGGERESVEALRAALRH